MKMEAEGVRLTKHQRTWLERIRAWEGSGIAMSAYAAEHGLDIRQMYDARRVLKQKGVLPSGKLADRFQRVEINAVPSAKEWCVQLPNGVTVSFSGAVDGDSLLRVLSTVAALG